jgi:hypothetical protein
MQRKKMVELEGQVVALSYRWVKSWTGHKNRLVYCLEGNLHLESLGKGQNEEQVVMMMCGSTDVEIHA